MSVSAAAIAKVAASLAQDKKVQKTIGTIVGIVLGIIILVIGCFFTIMSSITKGNSNIISTVFDSAQGNASINLPPDISDSMSASITQIQESFKKLNDAVTQANDRIAPEKLDILWLESVFFSVYFDKQQPDDDFYNSFVDCFITLKTINGVQREMPVTDDNNLFANLKDNLKLPITDEIINKAKGIYSQVKGDTISR
jgi:hypothetical protein